MDFDSTVAGPRHLQETQRPALVGEHHVGGILHHDHLVPPGELDHLA